MKARYFILIVLLGIGVSFLFFNLKKPKIENYSITLKIPKTIQAYLKDPEHEKDNFVVYEIKGKVFLNHTNVIYASTSHNGKITDLSQLFSVYLYDAQQGDLESIRKMYASDSQQNFDKILADAQKSVLFKKSLSNLESIEPLLLFEKENLIYVFAKHSFKGSTNTPVMPISIKQENNEYKLVSAKIQGPFFQNVNSALNQIPLSNLIERP